MSGQPAAPELDPPPGGTWVAADLFAFLRAVGASAEVDDATARALTLVALSSRGTSGEDVTISAEELAAALHVSKRTAWRRLSGALGTWLEQTTRPTTGRRGETGRRARYRLRRPESHATALLPLGTGERGESCASDPRDGGTGPTEVVCHSGPSRVPDSAESSAIDERAAGTVLPSVGPTSVGPPTSSRGYEGLPPFGREDWRGFEEDCQKAVEKLLSKGGCRDRAHGERLLAALATDSATRSPHRLTTLPGARLARELAGEIVTPTSRHAPGGKPSRRLPAARVALAEHPLGAAALEDARHAVGDAGEDRVTLEAAQLLADRDWRADQEQLAGVAS